MGVYRLVCHVTAFYYLWYGTPAFDGRYVHWNHSVLEHWSPKVQQQFSHLKGYSYEPPEKLHSPYYPLRGPYSVMDEETIRQQLEEMAAAGIDSVALSWWGRPDKASSADSQGVSTNAAVERFIAVADRQDSVKVSFHMEPYPGRTAESFREDVMYLHDSFGGSPSVQRLDGRMVFYVYDSYHIPVNEWNRVLKQGDLALPPDKYPGYYIALWVQRKDGPDIVKAGFDAAYTYFAATGFSYASSPQNWKSMADLLERAGLAFLPSVGPGYNDSKIRPWNTANTRSREDGRYYDNMWEAAVDSGAKIVTITSYNEWGEGTQIEAVEPRQGYESYEPHPPNYYLEQTAKWKEKLCFANADATGIPREQDEDEL